MKDRKSASKRGNLEWDGDRDGERSEAVECEINEESCVHFSSFI